MFEISGTIKVCPQGGTTQISSGSGMSGPCFCCTWCFQLEGLNFYLWKVSKVNSNTLYILGVSVGFDLAINSKGLPGSLIEVMLDGLWVTERALSAQIRQVP